MSGPDFDKPDKTFQTTLLIRLGKEGSGEARLGRDGLELEVDGDTVKVVEPLPSSPLFDKVGKKFDFNADQPVVIAEVQVRAERLRKEVFYLPALALLGLVVLLQYRRRGATNLVSKRAVA